MSSSDYRLLNRLETMRLELVDLAFKLDRGGHAAAADVAMEVSAQLAELRTDFLPPLEREIVLK